MKFAEIIKNDNSKNMPYLGFAFSQDEAEESNYI